MPDYLISNDLLRHMQYLLDEVHRLNAKIETALDTQKELAALMQHALAEVRGCAIVAS